MENKQQNIHKAIDHLKKVDKRLSKVIETIGPLHWDRDNSDSFFFITHEIVGQMLSSKVATIIFQRLIDLCEGIITPESISHLNLIQLRGIGLSTSKSTYIKELAEKIKTQEIEFHHLPSLTDTEIIKELKKINGVGNWTAKMYLLFFLEREDILPFEDSAFLQTYKWLYDKKELTSDEIITRCQIWKPYSSIASRYLYKALDTGLTKIPLDKFLKNEAN